MTSLATERLLASVRTFALDDPDPSTREYLLAHASEAHLVLLDELFAAPLQFGTAGLRAPLGAGPARMNRSVVARATAGVCGHLRSHWPDLDAPSLCIGYDARHGSLEFAREAAAVALGQGLTVYMFRAPDPTPLLAYAVRKLAAQAGIMVTASHNPPEYNGFKVYNERGAQLHSPADQAVSHYMGQVHTVLGLPRKPPEPQTAGFHWLPDTVITDYLAALPQLHRPQEHAPVPTPRIAYTAMHGVAGRLCHAALSRAGFVHTFLEPSQFAPDPDFPTVRFPNPEEPGALAKALALGESLEADLVLANDPDGDRLAVAARNAAGQLQALTGNDLGILLADALLAQAQAQGVERPLLCYTLVSTPLAARIAAHYSARAELTLTGFKWICNRSLDLEAQGHHFVFGFEEALGYALGQAVRDKDGIAAALVTAQLAARCAEQGHTLIDQLEQLCRRHGCFVSSQHALVREGREGQAAIATALQRLRTDPPSQIAGHPVVAIHDLANPPPPAASSTPAGLQALPPSNVLVLELAPNLRICLRPSGTEPKLKMYFDVIEPLASGEDLNTARARLQAPLPALATALVAQLGLDDGSPGPSTDS